MTSAYSRFFFSAVSSASTQSEIWNAIEDALIASGREFDGDLSYGEMADVIEDEIDEGDDLRIHKGYRDDDLMYLLRDAEEKWFELEN